MRLYVQLYFFLRLFFFFELENHSLFPPPPSSVSYYLSSSVRPLPKGEKSFTDIWCLRERHLGGGHIKKTALWAAVDSVSEAPFPPLDLFSSPFSTCLPGEEVGNPRVGDAIFPPPENHTLIFSPPFVFFFSAVRPIHDETLSSFLNSGWGEEISGIPPEKIVWLTRRGKSDVRERERENEEPVMEEKQKGGRERAPQSARRSALRCC